MTQVRRESATSAARPLGSPASSVTAVVVSQGLTEYLPRTLAALAEQTRPADLVLVVDAGDESDPDVELLARATWAGRPGRVRVLAAPGARSLGHAVRTALAASEPTSTTGSIPAGPGRAGTASTSWLWLLHDDSAPAATALAELLRAVEVAPSVAVAGCKQHSWADPVRVLEVGVATSRFGRRMTGIDEPEVDQGQHDGREDVLGVGTAGALVRRDVWDDLGGTDPALGPYGDGLDLSRRARLAGHRVVVVPRAVVRHAQASLARPIDGAVVNRPGWDVRRSVQARREAFLHSQIVGVPAVLVPVVAVLAVVSGAVRALGRLVTKEPHLVIAEVMAPWRILLRPGRVARARRRARTARRLSRRSLRPLQVTWRDVAAEARDRRLAVAERRRVRQAPSELEVAELRALRSRRRGTLVAVLVAAVAVTGVTLGPLVSRVLGGARLTGGALPFGDGGTGALWSAIASGHVDAGLGASAPADPLLLALLPLTALVRSVGGASALVLLGSVVMAAFGAWFAAGAATRSVALRAWASLVWAGAPALLLSVGQARLGAVLAHVALPWVVLGVARAVGVARVDVVESGLVGAERIGAGRSVMAPKEVWPRSGTAEPSMAAAAGAGLAFAAVTAGAPVLLPFGLLALLAVAAVARGRRRRLLWVAAPALAVQAPVVVEALRTWARGGWRILLADPGLPLSGGTSATWRQLLGWPVDPPAWWSLPEPVATLLPVVATGTVALVALLALAAPGRSARAVRAGWLVGACGLAAAVVAGRAHVGLSADGSQLVTGWPGPGVSLLLAGLVTAALVGAGAAREAMARASFGWRQVTVALVAVLAVAGPGLVVGEWAAHVATAKDLALTTSDVPVVPAIGRQLQVSDDAVRVLELSAADEQVDARVLRGDGVQLVDVSRVVDAEKVRGSVLQPRPVGADAADVEVADTAGRLAAGVSDDVAAGLAELGVGAVVVPPADGPDRVTLVGRLDSTAGLERVTETASGVIWRVAAPEGSTTAWARLMDVDSLGAAVLQGPVAASGRTVDTRVPTGSEQRVLVLAERADAGWHATLDGRPLRAVGTSWRQSFELGPEAGRLRVWHEAPARTAALVAQGVVLLAALLLAVPVRRRRGAAR
ncbi:MAG TPA: glycosyltransferase [Actinotalea sp.]